MPTRRGNITEESRPHSRERNPLPTQRLVICTNNPGVFARNLQPDQAPVDQVGDNKDDFAIIVREPCNHLDRIAQRQLLSSPVHHHTLSTWLTARNIATVSPEPDRVTALSNTTDWDRGQA
jgi:hypothetical protein